MSGKNFLATTAISDAYCQAILLHETPFWFTQHRLDGVTHPSAAFQLRYRTIAPSSRIQIFSSQFSERLTPLLREHKVFEQSVVPGAGLLALLGRLPELSRSHGYFLHLEDVTFLQPLIFERNESRDVQLTLPARRKFEPV